MAKDITIYKGPIHRLYSDNITMDSNQVVIKVKDKEVIEGNYYTVLGGYLNMEFDCVLANYEEAKTWINEQFGLRKGKIKKVLLSEDISDEKKNEFVEYLCAVTTCLYCEPSELVESHTMSKKEIKEYHKAKKKKN